MAQSLHITKRASLCFSVLCIVVTIILPAAASSASRHSGKTAATLQLDQEYYLILFGFKFLLPELVDLTLLSDGTFSLKSDLYIQPAQGTYTVVEGPLHKNALLIKGAGTTGIFLDPDFKEDIEIQYHFSGWLLGLRDVYLLGGGSRTFILYKDNHTIEEKFIISGPGL